MTYLFWEALIKPVTAVFSFMILVQLYVKK